MLIPHTISPASHCKLHFGADKGLPDPEQAGSAALGEQGGCEWVPREQRGHSIQLAAEMAGWMGALLPPTLARAAGGVPRLGT